MNNESSYFVILNRPDSFDLQRLADFLEPILSVPRLDVITQLKHSWGLLHKTQEIGKAQELQEKLKQEGIDTSVLSVSEIKKVPEAKVLKKAALEQHGLAYEEEGQKRSLPWSSFILVCAGQVEETESVKKRTIGNSHVARHLATTGLSFVTAVRISADRLKGKEVIEKKTDTTYLLDLIAGENSESIRIIGNSFNYSCLGDRMGYNVLMNFKNLYLDISKFLTNVIKNQGARAIETNVMKKMKYSSASDYENEILWLMQLTGRS